MDHMNDAPADVLVEARKNLKALFDSGLTREDLLNLIVSTDTAQSHTAAPVDDRQQQAFSPDRQDIKIEDVSSRAHFAPPGVIFSHQPRISVSSTSSGSSGRASIWSTGSSLHSAASVATHYSQSHPLPSQHATSQAPAQQSQTVTTAVPPQVATGQGGWATGRLNFYWCTSCETRFKRKYDWKRHEEEFHERWKKYPCPEPGCNRSFWGANTFNQHHKASHGCKTCPHSEKVVKFLRKRKYWACGFCSALHPSRERHVEHVARHFEAGKTKADWMHSRVVYGLLHQPLIHEAWKDVLASRHSEHAGQQPNFSWNPTKTGRAQGFLENECPGQLQDLLEFFSGSSVDAEGIVKLAYELSDIVFPSSVAPPRISTCQEMAAPQAQSCYPTPPDTALSPIAPSQPAQQQMAVEPTSPTHFTTHFGSMMTAGMFDTPQQPQQPQHPHQSQPHPQQQSQPPLQSQQQSHLHLQSQQSQPQTFSHTAQVSQVRRQAEQVSRASLDRALPPPPPDVDMAPTINFDFMSNNIIMEDWESFATTVVDESVPQSQVAADWPMVHYYPSHQ